MEASTITNILLTFILIGYMRVHWGKLAMVTSLVGSIFFIILWSYYLFLLWELALTSTFINNFLNYDVMLFSSFHFIYLIPVCLIAGASAHQLVFHSIVTIFQSINEVYLETNELGIPATSGAKKLRIWSFNTHPFKLMIIIMVILFFPLIFFKGTQSTFWSIILIHPVLIMLSTFIFVFARIFLIMFVENLHCLYTNLDTLFTKWKYRNEKIPNQEENDKKSNSGESLSVWIKISWNLIYLFLFITLLVSLGNFWFYFWEDLTAQEIFLTSIFIPYGIAILSAILVLFTALMIPISQLPVLFVIIGYQKLIGSDQWTELYVDQVYQDENLVLDNYGLAGSKTASILSTISHHSIWLLILWYALPYLFI